MRRYYRRRGSRRDSRGPLYIVLGYILLSSIAAIIKPLETFFVENIALILISTALILAFIIAHKAISSRYRDMILNQSEFISSVNLLNDSFVFNAVDNLDIKSYYDNENFFRDISEKDCLTYDLVYTKRRVLAAIEAARQNFTLFENYKQAVAKIKDKMDDAPAPKVLLARKYKMMESELFSQKVSSPTTDFNIVVTVTLTNIHGRKLTSKSSTFSSKSIEEIIKKLDNNEGGFYKNEEIWQSISRVERGKVTNKIRFMVYERDGHRCRKCGSTYNLEIDHIFPISKGGKTTLDNLQTLCHNCNVAKSNTLTEKQQEQYNKDHAKEGSVCPICEKGKLILRHSKNGDFYGCSNYPTCKFTKNIKI